MRRLDTRPGRKRASTSTSGAPARLEGLSGAEDPVLRLVAARAASGSLPGRRTDAARLALAIEGGGMAGTVSAGMGVALESLDFVASFDVIYGSSSGSLNASYLAGGQARSRASLYLRAAEERLIDLRRAARGRPPFRLAEVVNSLLPAHPHDERLLRGGPPLRVTATRVEDKRLDILTDFASVDEVRRAVWASCAIPILAGDSVDFRGTSYVDGGLVESLPYRVALREGATHVLVLRARPADYRFRDYPRPVRHLVDRLLRDAPTTLAELIRDRPGRYNAAASELQSVASGPLRGRVCQITPPPDARRVSQFEACPRALAGALRLGSLSAYAAIAPYLGQARAISTDMAEKWQEAA